MIGHSGCYLGMHEWSVVAGCEHVIVHISGPVQNTPCLAPPVLEVTVAWSAYDPDTGCDQSGTYPILSHLNPYAAGG